MKGKGRNSKDGGDEQGKPPPIYSPVSPFALSLHLHLVLISFDERRKIKHVDTVSLADKKNCAEPGSSPSMQSSGEHSLVTLV